MTQMVTQPPPSDLDHRFAALRSAVADALPPPATDRGIAAAIARAERNAPRAASHPRDSDRWLAWPLALAASVAVLSFLVRSLPPAAVVTEPTSAATQAAGNEFMPLVPLADIESAGDTMVVPARLPRMTLAQLGLPVNPARAAEAIDAELLVRRDGSVLAVRFVY
jgi:hypothetical protein